MVAGSAGDARDPQPGRGELRRLAAEVATVRRDGWKPASQTIPPSSGYQ